MKTKKQSPKTRFWLLAGMMLALVVVNIWFGLAWPLLEVKAGPTAPPRQTPTPSDSSRVKDKDKGDGLAGAYIELKTRSDWVGLWSVVQWQDASGDWHNVEGWRGQIEANGVKRWWVAPKDFHAGPFRWQVYQGENGVLLTTGTLFYLPYQANETVVVEVNNSYPGVPTTVVKAQSLVTPQAEQALIKSAAMGQLPTTGSLPGLRSYKLTQAGFALGILILLLGFGMVATSRQELN